jgi:hypothetical protein
VTVSQTEERVRSWAAKPENLELASTLFPIAGATYAELPGAPWFSLKMYSSVSKWTPQQWLAAVHWRWGAWAAMEGPGGDPRPIAKVAYFFRALERDVVSGTAPLIAVPQAFGAPRRAAVAELDADDIRELAEDVAFHAPGERRILSVDLNASDAAIATAFDSWLKQQRPLADRREALTAADMRTFSDSRAVPYLDLRLFELASGRSLRVGDVAAALFPVGSHELVVESPRKKLERATRRDAQRLLSRTWRDRLSAQFSPSP